MGPEGSLPDAQQPANRSQIHAARGELSQQGSQVFTYDAVSVRYHFPTFRKIIVSSSAFLRILGTPHPVTASDLRTNESSYSSV